MKRLLPLLLALLMLMGLPAALAEETQIPGTWEMTRFTVGDMVYNDPAAAHNSKVLVFLEDGSAVVTINRKSYSAVWTRTEEGIHLLYEDGDKADFTLVGDRLIYTTGDQIQEFTRRLVYAEAADFDYRLLEDGSAKIIGYNGSEIVLNIPKEIGGAPLRVIGITAFAGMDRLTSAVVPQGVWKVDQAAFMGCRKLVSVSLPESLRELGASAFQDCPLLASITLPEGLTGIPAAAFADCENLAAVSLPASLRKIGLRAFDGCQRLTHLTLPEGVESLADAVFMDCAALESLYLPASLTEIHGNPFAGCDALIVTAPMGCYAAFWCVENGIPYRAAH